MYELIKDIPETGLSKESAAQTGLRNLLRTDVRILESLFGTPGDIQSGLLNLANLVSQKTTGYQPFPEKILPLPTTEEVRGFTKKAEQFLPQGYLQPQSRIEKGVDEFVQDLTSFLHPLFGETNIAKAAVGLGTTGLGHLAKWGAESLGVSDEAAQGVKVGTMLLSSIGAKESLVNRAKNLYESAEKNIPVGLKITADPLQPVMDKISDVTSKGAKTPSKVFLNERLAELKKAISHPESLVGLESGKNTTGAKIAIEEAHQFIKDINEFFRENAVPKNAEGYMGELIDALKQSIKTAEKVAPQYVKDFTEGSNILKTINTSSRVNDFIQNIVDKSFKTFSSPLTPYLFGLPKAIGGAAIGTGIEFGSNVLDRAFRSKHVFNAYKDVVTSAIKEQAGPTARAINKLDKILVKEIKPEEFYQYELIK